MERIEELVARWEVSVRPPGASEIELREAEDRCGARLPPSYLAFLASANGIYAGGVSGQRRSGSGSEKAFGLLPANRIGWFRDLSRSTLDIALSGISESARRDDPVDPLFDSDSPASYLMCEFPDSIQRGYMLYALQISEPYDANVTLLDPLTRDAAGEWQAWQVAKDGASQYPSFAALLAAQTRYLPGQSNRQSEALARLPPPPTTADLVESLTGAQPEPYKREQAARMLGQRNEPSAFEALLKVADDPDPRVRAAVLGPLARRRETRARAAAARILADPHTQGGSIRSLSGPVGDALWDAYNQSERVDVLAQLLHIGDRRAHAPAMELLTDPRRSAEDRSAVALQLYALSDSDRCGELLEALGLPNAPAAEISNALLRLCPSDETIRASRVGLHRSTRSWQVELKLGHLGHPAALDVLLDALSEKATVGLIGALGWYSDPRSVAALTGLLADDTWRLPALYALEKMGDAQAAGAIWSTLGPNDALALRILARLHDSRAMQPLINDLHGDDARRARSAAIGLRDLGDPGSVQSLLTAAQGVEDAELALLATQALITLNAREAVPAVRALLRARDHRIKTIGEQWKRQLLEPEGRSK